MCRIIYSTGERPQRPLSTPHMRAVAAPQPTMRHSRTQADFLETQLSDHHHRRQERSEQFRQVGIPFTTPSKTELVKIC